EPSHHEYARVAALLRNIVAVAGLKLNPMSDLARGLAELDWMASFGVTPSAPGGAFHVDRKRGVAAFANFDYLRNLGEVATRCLNAPGFTSKARVLREKLCLLETAAAPSQTTVFELEIAA